MKCVYEKINNGCRQSLDLGVYLYCWDRALGELHLREYILELVDLTLELLLYF